MSTMDRADAQEWLESLQQVGEGWYRQVALAVKFGAHKALGMTPREFARQIGQKMIDPANAVIELHGEGHTKERIAAVLGLSHERVHNILVAEGKIVGEPRPTGGRTAALAAAKATDEETPPARGPAEEETPPARGPAEEAFRKADAARRDAVRKAEALEAQVAGERKRLADLKDKHAATSHDLQMAKRKIKELTEGGPSEQDKERIRKELQAWAHEEENKLLSGMSHIVLAQAVGGLEDAREGIVELRNRGWLTTEAVAQIQDALGKVTEELALSKFMAGGE